MASSELLMLRRTESPSRRSPLATTRGLVSPTLTNNQEDEVLLITGQYSYIDENGNNIVVKYSAGVNGFR